MTHIKRLAASKSIRARKTTKYIARPEPGAHPLQDSITITYLLRDLLNIAATAREVNKILQESKVLVDGKPRKSLKFSIGIMDKISIPSINEHYIMVYNEQGKLSPKKIDQKSSSYKTCKIINKKILSGKKIQINFYDSKNLIINDNSYKPGDSVVLSLPDLKPQKHLKLEKGSLVILTAGKHKGMSGNVEEIKIFKGTEKNRIVISHDDQKIETLKDYAFVIDKEM